MSDKLEKVSQMDSITHTVAQVADLLQVSQLTVRRMWIRKTFPAPVQVARMIRWRKSDVEKWLAEQPTSGRYETEVENENAK